MIIGICGTGDRCGKTTFAEQLQDLIRGSAKEWMLGPSCYLKQFSTPIKKLVADYYGMSLLELEAVKDVYQGDGYRPRDWFRMLYQEPEKMNPDFWFNQLINTYVDGEEIYLITDLRDSYKAARIKEMRGLVILVNGTGHNVDTIFSMVPDYTIDNSNYDLGIMKQQVKAVFNNMIERKLI